MGTVGVAFLVALGIWILMLKINISFFAKYHWQSDVIISAGLTFLFFGTFSGMVTALIAGIFISLFLYLSRVYLQKSNAPYFYN